MTARVKGCEYVYGWKFKQALQVWISVTDPPILCAKCACVSVITVKMNYGLDEKAIL